MPFQICFQAIIDGYRSYAGGCAGIYQVACFKSHETRYIGNDLLKGEDHQRGIPVLDGLSVQVQPEGEVVDIAELLKREKFTDGR